jgi:hypothetical protein
MEIYEKARLAQLAAKLRLNALNGNAANGASPGYAVRPAKANVSRSSAASVTGPAPAARKPEAITLPPSFDKLKIDVEELVPHLSNARELYTAKSAVSKTANQLYGTMLDVTDDDDDMSDYLIEDDAAMVEEGDMELGAEAIRAGEADSDSEDESSGEWGQVESSGLDASA